MRARIRKAMEEKDQGFTLIELLVVMIIIGILAAIAVPVFLNQRTKAVDSSIKSDLKTVATNVETAMVDTQSYPASITTSTGAASGNKITVTAGNDVALSNGNVIAYALATGGNGFCLRASNAKSNATGGGAGNNGNYFFYSSASGGLGTTPTATVPAGCSF